MAKKSRRKPASSQSLPEWSSLPVPKEGWAFELKEAESLWKKDRTNVSRALRHCQALFVMRQWEKLEKAATSALATVSEGNDLSTFKKAQAIAKKHTMIETALDSLCIQESLNEVFRYEANVDELRVLPETFSDLNILQSCALAGDIRVLERLVALGAALDHPPLKEQSPQGDLEAAPPMCTALLLACTLLAASAVIAKFGLISPDFQLTLNGTLECAIQLVRLGADCQAKLIIPADRRGEVLSQWRDLKYHNKTAQELAILSGKRDLIKTMEIFQGKDARELVHCRCGSRLPWKDCHLGGFGKDVPIAFNVPGVESRMCYRYSPLAPCWCELTKKTHYDCCWFSADPRIHNDRDGSCFVARVVSPKLPGGEMAMEAFARLQTARMAQGASESDPLITSSRDEMCSAMAKMIRKMGIGLVIGMCIGPEKMRKMDAEVYAGCVERIPDYFFWYDDHWRIEKAELLLRVKEWNEALDKYCNEKGLTGKRREEVMELHRASPYALCANPSCNTRETKVKQFKRCSRCRTVAYCSQPCQAGHWKSHRKGCIQR